MSHHIFTHKIFDDLFAEYLTGIIRDMADSQTLCQMAGIFQIFGRVVQLIETEVTPVTSYPASSNRMAATELSVPPLIPNNTRLFSSIMLQN